MLAADTTFSIPLAIAVESLLASARPGTVYDIHVLDDAVTPGIKEYLESLHGRYEFAISYHCVSEIVKNVIVTKQFPRVAFARFLFDRFLPEHVLGKIFYTDADILFCDDLTPLFQLDMKGHPVAATQAINLVARDNRVHIGNWAKVFHIDETAPCFTYFQNGTLLFDRIPWRKSGYGEKIVSKGEEMTVSQVPFPDQDIMNAVCYNDIALLPAKYGVIPLFERRYSRDAYDANFAGRCAYSSGELEQALQSPAVLHFAGVKPQVLEGPHYVGEERFIDFWKQSAWRDFLPYAPQHGTQGTAMFLEPGRKLSEQLGGLRKRALKYSILRYLVWGERRARYKTWATGLAGILKAMKS